MRIGWQDFLSGAAARFDGSDVEITGWVIAAPRPGSGYALIGPEPVCCAGCVPRDPGSCVEVFATAPIRPQARALRFSGRLAVVEGTGWRYRLDDARALDPPGWGGGPRVLSRRGVLAGGPLLCLAGPAAAQGSNTQAARAVIAGGAAVDMHSHAGGLTGVRRVESAAPFLPVADPMRQGGMAVVCFAIVSDSPTHKLMPDHRLHPYRDPAPGELYTYSQKSFQRAHDLVRAQGLQLVTDTATFRGARAGVPSAIIAAEGADFTEGLPDRVDEAYARWQLRHLQLTHYRVNELGDIQTEAPVHGGLTDAGAEIVRRCNRLGIVVDVAHGTFDLVKRAAAVTTKPLILSHTSLTSSSTERAAQSRTRLISAEHAQIIASTGGVIGVWPEASRFPTLDDMARGMRHLADIVGVEHIGLGSDMMGLVGPSVFDTYAALPELAEALLGNGFSAEETGKVLGGNYARVFAASLA